MLLPIFNPSLGRREKLPQKVGRKEKLAAIGLMNKKFEKDFFLATIK